MSGQEMFGSPTSHQLRHRVVLGINGQHDIGRGRINNYSLETTYSVAQEGADTTHSHKIHGEWGHFRALNSRTHMTGALQTQWAFTNLDASERMKLSGQTGVRAYRDGGIGDLGWLGKLEFHRLLSPNWLNTGEWRGAAYIEGGSVQVSRFPTNGDAEVIHRYGVGINVTWSLPTPPTNRAVVQLDRAWPIGAESAAERRGQFWLRLSYQF